MTVLRSRGMPASSSCQPRDVASAVVSRRTGVGPIGVVGAPVPPVATSVSGLMGGSSASAARQLSAVGPYGHRRSPSAANSEEALTSSTCKDDTANSPDIDPTVDQAEQIMTDGPDTVEEGARMQTFADCNSRNNLRKCGEPHQPHRSPVEQTAVPMLDCPAELTGFNKPQQDSLLAVADSLREQALVSEPEPTTSTSGVPVFVMLPLDTVTSEGILRYGNSKWFSYALQSMHNCGVHGVAVDVWWGAVERQAGVYDWTAYKHLVSEVKALGLKMQMVLSFHACGGNVGDSAMIPLPDWVLEAGDEDPDIFFTDRPRGNRRGQRNRECISFFADEAAGVLAGRSPVQCYQDFMMSFAEEFGEELGTMIEEVVVGCGPCGELRYPSYVEANGWRFPGVGEFQCYDRRALAELAKASAVTGHPEWGEAGPHDAGWYNSVPEDTGFFSAHDGSWDSPYGRFFMEWYSSALIAHGERLLQAARVAFGHKMKRGKSCNSVDMEVDLEQRPSLGTVPVATAKAGPIPLITGVDSSSQATQTRVVVNGPGSSSPWEESSMGRGSSPGSSPRGQLEVTLKVAGIHWYYRTRSHAAELTAGYYNTAMQNGYEPLIALCAKHGAALTLTCVEMCDAQHPSGASCSPEGLLHQVRKTACEFGVPLAGENALPCFSPGGVDATALERIIRNTSEYNPLHKPSPLTWGSFAPPTMSTEKLRGSIASSMSSSCSDVAADTGPATPPTMEDDSSTILPAMRSFTFLRLNQEMIAPAYQGVWMRFMQRMHSGDREQQSGNCCYY